MTETEGVGGIILKVAGRVGGKENFVGVARRRQFRNGLEIIVAVGHKCVAGGCNGTHPVSDFSQIVVAGIAGPFARRQTVIGIAADVSPVVDSRGNVSFIVYYLVNGDRLRETLWSTSGTVNNRTAGLHWRPGKDRNCLKNHQAADQQYIKWYVFARFHVLCSGLEV
jgi:hypothetical protein